MHRSQFWYYTYSYSFDLSIMGKNSGNKKRKRQDILPKAHLPTPPSTHDSPSEENDNLVSPSELNSTLLVLRTLLENPEELDESYLKPLKRDIHDLHSILTQTTRTTPGSSLTARISSALQESRFTDALILLFEMLTRGVPPKLGAVQRWVRECDATSDVGGEGDKEAMRCLDMILRVASMGMGSEQEGGGKVVKKRKEVWRARQRIEGEVKIWEMMSQDKLFGEFRVLLPLK